MSSTCRGLKQGFDSRPVTEVGWWQWEHRIPATRPVVSDKPWPYGSAEKEFPQRRKVVKQVKYLLGEKSTVRVDRHTGGWERVAPSWQFKSLIWDISSMLPLTNHFDLLGSVSIFGVSQDLPMCAGASLSQDGFCRRGLWVVSVSWHHSPLDLQGAFLRMCSRGGLLTLRMRNMRSLIFYLGRAQPPPSIVLLLPSQSIGPQGTDSNPFAPGAHLSPASSPHCVIVSAGLILSCFPSV